MSKHVATTSKDFLVKIKDVYKRIRLDDIYYFKSEGKYILLSTDSREFVIKIRLKSLLEILPPNFIRCHASYLINTDKVSSLSATTHKIKLVNDIEIPLSRTYKDELFSCFVVS